jgi:hypothetical protein
VTKPNYLNMSVAQFLSVIGTDPSKWAEALIQFQTGNSAMLIWLGKRLLGEVIEVGGDNL